MATKKLNTFVHVDGVAYGPDDDVPAEVAEKITAPGVWGEVEEAEVDPVKAGEPTANPAVTDDKPVDDKPTGKPAGGAGARR